MPKIHVCLQTLAHSSVLYTCISTSLKLLLKSYYLGYSCMDILFRPCKVGDHSALEQEMDVLVTFFVVTSMDQSNLRSVFVYSPRQSPPWQGSHGSRSRKLVSNQEAESNEGSSSDSFHHCMQFRTSAHEMTSSTPRQTKYCYVSRTKLRSMFLYFRILPQIFNVHFSLLYIILIDKFWPLVSLKILIRSR